MVLRSIRYMIRQYQLDHHVWEEYSAQLHRLGQPFSGGLIFLIVVCVVCAPDPLDRP